MCSRAIKTADLIKFRLQISNVPNKYKDYYHLGGTYFSYVLKWVKDYLKGLYLDTKWQNINGCINKWTCPHAPKV